MYKLVTLLLLTLLPFSANALEGNIKGYATAYCVDGELFTYLILSTPEGGVKKLFLKVLNLNEKGQPEHPYFYTDNKPYKKS